LHILTLIRQVKTQMRDWSLGRVEIRCNLTARITEAGWLVVACLGEPFRSDLGRPR
jgi:hypothetical protein